MKLLDNDLDCIWEFDHQLELSPPPEFRPPSGFRHACCQLFYIGPTSMMLFPRTNVSGALLTIQDHSVSEPSSNHGQLLTPLSGSRCIDTECALHRSFPAQIKVSSLPPSILSLFPLNLP